VDRQYAKVDCPGSLELVARQDFDGRPLDEPTPVTINWAERMTLWGKDNVAWFDRDIHVVRGAGDSVVTCDRLRVDFQDVPPEPAGESRLWVLGKAIQQLRDQSSGGDSTLDRRIRKRPAVLSAQGHVVATSTKRDKSGQRRIQSLQITGPEMAVDLLRNQLDVFGAGSLLIEDYRLETNNKRTVSDEQGGTLLGNLAGGGPSQTAVTWGDAMTLFSDSNLVTFFGNVLMVHRAGRDLAMGDQLAESLRVDKDKLRYLASRSAELQCRQLAVQFVNTGSSDAGSNLAGGRATDVQRMEAEGDVLLVDGPRSLRADQLVYNAITHVVTIAGTGNEEARILAVDEKTGELALFSQGRVIRWNRLTGEIEVEQPYLQTP